MQGPRRSVQLVTVALALMLALAATFGLGQPMPVQAQENAVTLEWWGWSHFRLTSPNGKVILLNPFITGNPDAAVSLDDIMHADLILAADGHRDEVGDTAEIAQRTGAMVFAAGGGVNGWLIEQGVPQAQIPQRFAQPGNVLRLDGITVRMLNSIHGSELPQPTMANPYGGIAGSYMITFENGYTIYFQGSSAATVDMALWAEMYKPDLMIFHMGGQHDPLDVAMSIRLMTTNNPNLRNLVPHHHRAQVPAGQTSIADVEQAMGQLGVSIPITDVVRSQVYNLTK
ncbi:MAG: MBL fold metallo-hydrolase [Chloroflexota bacterium]|nr:MBL fold metallo-hydrolase [Chloroflexota bacterium]